MLRNNLHLLGLTVLGLAVLPGCALKKMKKKAYTISYEVVPEHLEVHGDSVKVTINGALPRKYFNKRATVEVVPVIRYADGRTEAGSYMLKGEKVVGDGALIMKKTGGSFTYSRKVAYTPAMEKSELYLELTARRKAKELEFEELKLADGTIITSLRAQKTEVAMLGKDNYKKVVPVQQKGKFMFEINRSELKASEKKTASATMEEFIKAGHMVEGMNIMGYASPDGAFELNDKLSAARTQKSFSYMKDYLKKQGVARANDSAFFKTEATAEDWDGLREMAAKAEFTDRDALVKIVNTVSDIKARETEMKKLDSYKKTIAKDLLPPLRRAELVLKATEKRRPDAEISQLAKGDAKQLTAEELLYAATMTENWDEKMNIYKTYADLYPGDWRGYNNMAYVYLTKGGNNKEAKELLDKANKISKDNPVVYNNLGVVFRNEGDYKNAESYYLLAQSLGADESLNMGNIKVKQGDYASAVSYYGSKHNCTVNNGLANLLAANYDAAKRALDCSGESADAYYLKAVVGARTGNLDALTTNLTRAIKENSKYRAEALKDLEFEDYRETDAFKVAVR